MLTIFLIQELLIAAGGNMDLPNLSGETPRGLSAPTWDAGTGAGTGAGEVAWGGVGDGRAPTAPPLNAGAGEFVAVTGEGVDGGGVGDGEDEDGTPSAPKRDSESPVEIAGVSEAGLGKYFERELTRLHVAVMKDDLEAVKQLLERDPADVRKVQPLTGNSALHFSAMRVNSLSKVHQAGERQSRATATAIFIQKLLVDAGGDMDLPNHEGKTPKDLLGDRPVGSSSSTAFRERLNGGEGPSGKEKGTEEGTGKDA